MANHKSALKRIRSNEKRRVLNRYQHKTTRNAIKALRLATDKSDATAKLSGVISMIDKLAKKNVIHDNKASNLKSKLTKHVAKLKSYFEDIINAPIWSVFFYNNIFFKFSSISLEIGFDKKSKTLG